MPRLFVAIDLPDEVKAELLRLQPPSGNGVRLTKPEQMHLTLHFLGEAELEPAITALAGVAAAAFSMAFDRIGMFGSARRGTILWAGIQENAELQQLHSAIAQALEPTGYQPEPRPFSPHITLARCKPGTPRRVIEDFLRQEIPLAVPPIVVNEFSLYSSVTTSDGSQHHCEQTVRLV